ncbi:hypothetical protein [Rhizobium wenxiniae]|uniref:hypothetical protein n=1 Tax=Rhizobium wenxiniae TaxID=1737357 RepID=UPI003C159429
MQSIVILYIVINSFTGNLVRVSEFPDMESCKQAVTSAQYTKNEDVGLLLKKDWRQSEWKTPVSEYLCISGNR